MAELEQFSLDGYAFNDATNWDMVEFDFGVARKRYEWITGADADGAQLVRDPLHDNVEMTATLRAGEQASMDAALAQIGEIVAKLEECERHENGLAGVHIAADGSVSNTARVLSGEVVGIPVSIDSGWFQQRPTIQIVMHRKPYWYGEEVGNVLDDFSSDTIGAGDWTFQTGTGTLAVLGGQLVPSSTAEKRLYHNPRTYSDGWVTVKGNVPVLGVTVSVGAILRVQDTNNFLYAYLRDSGAATTLNIAKLDGGVFAFLNGGAASTRIIAGADFWVRARAEGNVLTIEHWSSAPTATGTPTATATYTLAGADATQFGEGVAGYMGIVFVPSTTNDRMDDFTFEPNVFKSSTPLVTGIVHDVEGDVPAEGRLIFTDAAGQNRRHAEWGLESRHYSAGKPRILDQFGVDTIGSGAWVFDTGSGTIAVSGGLLVPSSTVEKRMYRVDGTYVNLRATLKYTTGASAAGTTRILLKRIAADTYISANINTVGQLQLFKVVAGAATQLGSDVAGSASAATSYWLRATLSDGAITWEQFTADPASGASPAATNSHTLSAADAAIFAAASGHAGVRLSPQATDWRYDDFRIDPLSGSTELLLGSDGPLTVLGFGGTQTTRTGAYTDGTVANHVIRGTLTTSPIAICGTGNLSHVGTFRVKARVYSSAADAYIRLSWQEGDGPFRANAYARVTTSSQWREVDLGLISIPEKVLGTQRWTGRIEAYHATIGTTLDVDYLVLIPVAEGYGKARAAAPGDSGVLLARDEFTGIASTTALNGRAAPTGGNWATSGSAGDFTAADAPGSEETESRSTTGDASPRYAILGTTNHTDTDVRVAFQWSDAALMVAPLQGMAIARWTDASNHLRLVVASTGAAVRTVIAGAATDLANISFLPTLSEDTWYTLRLVAYASGGVYASVSDSTGTVLGDAVGYSSALATGGTLASGESGFADFYSGGSAFARYYDNFATFTPLSEAIVVASGQSAEFRYDSAIREDSSGTYWGPVPAYRGSRFLLPPAGDEARTSRILVKARRNDVDLAADDNIADSTTVQVVYTPRYLTPR